MVVLWARLKPDQRLRIPAVAMSDGEGEGKMESGRRLGGRSRRQWKGKGGEIKDVTREHLEKW